MRMRNETQMNGKGTNEMQKESNRSIRFQTPCPESGHRAREAVTRPQSYRDAFPYATNRPCDTLLNLFALMPFSASFLLAALPGVSKWAHHFSYYFWLFGLTVYLAPRKKGVLP